MKKLVLAILFAGIGLAASGSHLRCGYITATRTSCTSRTYIIEIVVMTNTYSDVQFGGDGILTFGDGTNMVVPLTTAEYRPDLGPTIGVARFSIQHTYASVAPYLISYVEPNRNGGVLNMDNSFYTTFYTETRIDLNHCNSSPRILAPPLFSGLEGNTLSVSLAASSDGEELLTYSLVTPFRDRGLPVVNYKHPENLVINPFTGQLTWDLLLNNIVKPGEYNFAVHVNASAKEGTEYINHGYVRVDFQVIVYGNSTLNTALDDNQSLDEYNRVLVQENEEKKIKVLYKAPAAATPTLQLFSQLTDPVVSFITYDSTSGTTGDNFKVGIVSIKPTATIIRTHAYAIVVRGSANTNTRNSTDLTYLVYTEEIPNFPELPVITNLEEEGPVTVSVFPNPVQNVLTVKPAETGHYVVLLYSGQGLLMEQHETYNEAHFSLHTLPRGIYLCEVYRNNRLVHKTKLMKQ